MPRLNLEQRRERRQKKEERAKQLRARLYAQGAALRKDERKERTTELIQLGARVETAREANPPAFDELMRLVIEAGPDQVLEWVRRGQAPKGWTITDSGTDQEAAE